MARSATCGAGDERIARLVVERRWLADPVGERRRRGAVWCGRLGRMHEAARDADDDDAIGRLAAAILRQEELTEQFKSNNALLGNSLAYFGLFSSHLGSPDQRGALGPSVAALATAMLRLTLDTSPVTVQEVNERLNEVAVQSEHPGDAGEVQALLAHGREYQRGFRPTPPRPIAAVATSAAACGSLIQQAP